MENKLQEYWNLFKSKKIKMTDVRLAMLKIIITKKHFVISELISLVEQELGSVNVMSIYNNIDLFLSLHLLFANTINGKQIMYEAITPKLVHIKCDNCDYLDDLENSDFSDELFNNFKKFLKKENMDLNHFKLELHVICETCKNKE